MDIEQKVGQLVLEGDDLEPEDDPRTEDVQSQVNDTQNETEDLSYIRALMEVTEHQDAPDMMEVTIPGDVEALIQVSECHVLDVTQTRRDVPCDQCILGYDDIEDLYIHLLVFHYPETWAMKTLRDLRKEVLKILTRYVSRKHLSLQQKTNRQHKRKLGSFKNSPRAEEKNLHKEAEDVNSSHTISVDSEKWPSYSYGNSKETSGSLTQISSESDVLNKLLNSSLSNDGQVSRKGSRSNEGGVCIPSATDMPQPTYYHFDGIHGRRIKNLLRRRKNWVKPKSDHTYSLSDKVNLMKTSNSQRENPSSIHSHTECNNQEKISPSSKSKIKYRRRGYVDGIHKCRWCKETFKTHKKLKKHAKQNHPEKQLKCRSCTKVFYTWPDKRKHDAKHHQEEAKIAKDLENREISKTVADVPCSDRENPSSIHSGIENYNQEEISPSAKDRVKCRRRGYVDGVHQCRWCKEIFKMHKKLKKHAKQNHPEKQLKCRRCTKVFYTWPDKRKHDAKHRKEEANIAKDLENREISKTVAEEINVARSSVVTCMFCEGVFASHQHLERHYAEAHPFVCCYCDNRFSTNLSLKIHLDAHLSMYKSTREGKAKLKKKQNRNRANIKQPQGKHSNGQGAKKWHLDQQDEQAITEMSVEESDLNPTQIKRTASTIILGNFNKKTKSSAVQKKQTVSPTAPNEQQAGKPMNQKTAIGKGITYSSKFTFADLQTRRDLSCDKCILGHEEIDDLYFHLVIFHYPQTWAKQILADLGKEILRVHPTMFAKYISRTHDEIFGQKSAKKKNSQSSKIFNSQTSLRNDEMFPEKSNAPESQVPELYLQKHQQEEHFVTEMSEEESDINPTQINITASTINLGNFDKQTNSSTVKENQEVIPTAQNKQQGAKPTNHKTLFKEKTFVCKACSAKFKDYNKFVKHNYSHRACHVCGKIFPSYSEMRHHMMKVHYPGDPQNAYHICSKGLNGYRLNSKCKKQRPKARNEPQGATSMNKKTLFKEKTFVCKVCSEKFKDYNKFNEHKNIHQVCHVCDEVFPSYSEMRHHMMKVHYPGDPQNVNQNTEIQMKHQQKEKQYICNVCREKFNDYDKFCQHKYVHRVCHICGKVFSFYSEMTYHVMVTHYPGEPRNVCHACKKSFRLDSEYKEHMAKHSDERNFMCDICTKSFKTKRSLNEHKSTRHNVRQPKLKKNKTKYVCYVCRDKFEDYDKFCEHKTVHLVCHICKKDFSLHTKMTYHVMVAHYPGEPRNACHICKKSFRGDNEYKRHMTFHSERNFICEVCGMRFPTEYLLKQHEIVHSEVKPFKCHLCDLTFKRKSELRQHIEQKKGHGGAQKPYKCRVCEKMFYTLLSLRVHKRNAHRPKSERKYKCNICSKTFSLKASLDCHMDMHMGKKYPCPICNRGYSQRRYVDKHIKLVHKRPGRKPRGKVLW